MASQRQYAIYASTRSCIMSFKLGELPLCECLIPLYVTQRVAPPYSAEIVLRTICRKIKKSQAFFCSERPCLGKAVH